LEQLLGLKQRQKEEEEEKLAGISIEDSKKARK
jgi:hypothetical protein